MLDVLTGARSAPSRGILLATLLAAAGLGGNTGFSVAQLTQAEAPMSIDRPASVQLAQATPSAATSVNEEKDAIHKVLSGYYDSFGRDSAAASAFYGEPTLIVLPNQVVMLSTRADVEAFFEKFVASLKPSGYSHSKLGDHRIKLLNPTTALYSTVAVRMKADGTEMQRSGFTYLLHKSNAGWRIHEIVATDLDKLISAD
jgi:ketosteroid isomerase-like protein